MRFQRIEAQCDCEGSFFTMQAKGIYMKEKAPSPRRVLIVDDKEPILKAMAKYFRAHDYIVDSAREQEEAEAMLTHSDYSIVIADLRLTGINGTEGLNIVRFARQRWPNMRLILLTAYGSPEIEQEARCCGVDVFLHKPIPMGELAQVVSELLEGKR